MPKKIDEEYKDSEVWVCEESPTGAHYWVQPDASLYADLNLDDIPFQCKHCRAIKYMESFFTVTTWHGWRGSNAKPDYFGKIENRG